MTLPVFFTSILVLLSCFCVILLFIFPLRFVLIQPPHPSLRPSLPPPPHLKSPKLAANTSTTTSSIIPPCTYQKGRNKTTKCIQKRQAEKSKTANHRPPHVGTRSSLQGVAMPWNPHDLAKYVHFFRFGKCCAGPSPSSAVNGWSAKKASPTSRASQKS